MRDERDLKPGDVVQHFKRELITNKSSDDYLYQILEFAKHSETNEELVVYKALYGDGATWVRPYEMFMGMVDKNKYPEIKQIYRFEKVTEHEKF